VLFDQIILHIAERPGLNILGHTPAKTILSMCRDGRTVEGIENPILDNRSSTVPAKAGLSVALHDLVRRRLTPKAGHFVPTPQWE
jgi:hypothetical protein